jgi:hypothetical protein
MQIFSKRAPTGALLRRDALPEGKKADGARCVVKPYSVTVECAANCRFIHVEGRFQRVVALMVEEQIAEIMMTICPTRIGKIKQTAHFERLRIEDDIVKSEISVNKNAIVGGDAYVVKGIKGVVDLRQESSVINDPR